MNQLMSEPVVDFVFKIIMAFLVGALIGLERERTRIVYLARKKHGEQIKTLALPGVRSFGLLSLYGMVSAYISQLVAMIETKIIIEAFFSSILFIILFFYLYRRTIMGGATGITTYIVMSLSVMLGFLVGFGKLLEAVSTSSLITLILAIKPSIERFVKEIEYNELLSGLELALFVFVLGPFFLLGHPELYGIDLSKFYLLFIIILALSYFSYIAVKLRGSRALKYIAFLGGLVNSEAAASNIAGVLDRQTGVPDNRIGSLMLSNLSLIIAAMILRNLIIVTVLAYPLFDIRHLIIMVTVLLTSMIIPLIYGVKVIVGREELGVGGIKVTIENPISYSVAFKVITAYTLIFILGYAMSLILPPEYLVIIAFVGGLINAGATILTFITLSQIMSLGYKFILLLVVTANMGAIFNKILFIKTVSSRRVIIISSIKAIILSLISTLIAVAVMIITA